MLKPIVKYILVLFILFSFVSQILNIENLYSGTNAKKSKLLYSKSENTNSVFSKYSNSNKDNILINSDFSSAAFKVKIFNKVHLSKRCKSLKIKFKISLVLLANNTTYPISKNLCTSKLTDKTNHCYLLI